MVKRSSPVGVLARGPMMFDRDGTRPMPNLNKAFNIQRFFFVTRVVKLKIHVSRQVK